MPGSARRKEKRGEDSSSSFSVSLGTHPVDTSRPSGSPVVTASCTEVGPGPSRGRRVGRGTRWLTPKLRRGGWREGTHPPARAETHRRRAVPGRTSSEHRASWCFLSTGDEHRELTASSRLSQCQGLGKGPQDLGDAEKLKLIIDREKIKPTGPSIHLVCKCVLANFTMKMPGA